MLYIDIETTVSSTHPILDQYIESKCWLDKLWLYPETARILAIGLKKDDQDIKIRYGDEKWMLVAINSIDTPDYLVWRNIKKFDIPFIIRRSLHYWIKLWPLFAWISSMKPREIKVIDLMEIWSCNMWYTTLESCCLMLWLQNPKKYHHWSEISSMSAEEIKTYLIWDVQANYDIYQFFKKYNVI